MKNALLLLLAASAGCIFLFGGSLTGGRFLVDPTWSMDTYHLSLLYESAGKSLAAGHYPFFFPELSGGYPVPAAWMYGLFYPPTALFALVPPDAGWSLSATLHLLLAALGMFLFLRQKLESDEAAAVGAFVFAFSEFMVGRVVGGHLNLVWPVAWIPWTLWAAGRCARRERGGIPLLGLVLGAGLVSGHVQIWFYVAPVLALFAVGEAVRAPSRAWAALAGGTLLALGISAVQWVATAELVSETGGIQVSEELLRDLSVPVPVLAAKLFPGFMGHLPAEAEGGTSWAPGPFAHETVAVGGLAVLFLVVLGCFGKHRGKWFWLAVLAAGLLLAPGRLNPLSALLGKVPPFSLSRAAARALVLTLLGASVLAGHGAAAWLSGSSAIRGGRLKLAIAVTAGLATAALVGLGIWGFGDVPGAERSERLSGTCLPAVLESLGGLAVLVAALALVRWRPRAAPLLPLVLFAVLLGTAVPPVATTPSEFYFRDWSRALPEEAMRHRVYVYGERFPNLERQGVRGYRLMSPADVPWYLRVARQGSPRHRYWLDTALIVNGLGRSEVLSGPPYPHPRIVSAFPGCGRGMLFTHAEVVPNDDVAMERLDAGRRELLLAEHTPLPAGAAPAETIGAPGAIFRPQPDPNRVRFEVTTPVPAYLYVSEKYYPGRRATVDGVEVPCVRANVCGVAVPVPAGRHEVVVEYTTVARSVGLPVSLITLIACIAALLAPLWRSGRGRPAPEE